MFAVDSLTITHNCWLYVDSRGVFMMNGPVAISLPFRCAFCSLVDVMGGPTRASTPYCALRCYSDTASFMTNNMRIIKKLLLLTGKPDEHRQSEAREKGDEHHYELPLVHRIQSHLHGSIFMKHGVGLHQVYIICQLTYIYTN